MRKELRAHRRSVCAAKEQVAQAHRRNRQQMPRQHRQLHDEAFPLMSVHHPAGKGNGVPVSYTHLDVYKRQSFTRAVLPDGQHAVSQYAVEKVFQEFSLVRLSPLTGRTHQLLSLIHI